MSIFSTVAHAAPTHQALTLEDKWLNVERPLVADDLKGRIILVDFWTYCCINCIHIMPDLAELEDYFGDDLTVIGVHSAKFNNEKETENIRQAVLRYNIHHAVVNDADFRIWRSFGVRAWPTLVLINPKGEIERVYSGEGNKEAIRADVERLRKEFSGQFVSTPLPYKFEKATAPTNILSYPGKVTPAYDRELLFISDSNNNRIIGLSMDGEIKIEIGAGPAGNEDGAFETATFNQPQGVVYRNGIIYVADTKNHSIRKINLETEQVSTVAGTGKQGYNRRVFNEDALSTELASPWDVAFYPNNNHLAIAMAGTHQLWTLDLEESEVSVLAGNGRESIDDGAYPLNSLSQPSGLAPYKNKLYFVDSETSSLRVLEDGKITTLIGEGLFEFGLKDGKKQNARMQHTLGVYADDSGVYLADTYNHAIRKYNPETGTLTTLSGSGERGFENGDYKNSTYSEPNDILRLPNGELLVMDTNNHAIRILQNNMVKTLPIIPKLEESQVTYSDVLPNVEIAQPKIISTKTQLKFEAKEGWKINNDAPTYFAIFDENKNVVTIFNKEEIKQKILPLTLTEGAYTAQGVFYICEAQKESFCYLKSVEQQLTVQQAGQATLPVNLIIPQM